MGLVGVGGKHTLEEKAAASYKRMLEAGCPPWITSSTRSYAKQYDWWLNQGKPGYPAKAANPNTSKHVWRPDDKNDQGGRALDLPEPARAWARSHGAAFGWMKDRVSNEPWHLEYEIANDTNLEDEVTKEEYEKLLDELAWIHKRLGGSTSWPSITERLDAIDKQVS